LTGSRARSSCLSTRPCSPRRAFMSARQ
jgi:hypothetical protein